MSSNKTEFFAHTLPDCTKNHWQPLDQHLLQVAEGAAKRAGKFSGEGWGYCAGLWHDIGKYSSAFQEYLANSAAPDSHRSETAKRGSVDHSTAGAQHAAELDRVLGHILAYCIAGHHAGLADAIDPEGRKSGLRERLDKAVEPWRHGLHALPEQRKPELPAPLKGLPRDEAAFAWAMFTRMVFSALCDADFIDTEAFLDPMRAQERPDYRS
ncbi:MAG: CRISPR-associated endonuclease Cas3'', partial [Myxococcota bacterium]